MLQEYVFLHYSSVGMFLSNTRFSVPSFAKLADHFMHRNLNCYHPLPFDTLFSKCLFSTHSAQVTIQKLLSYAEGKLYRKSRWLL